MGQDRPSLQRRGDESSDTDSACWLPLTTAVRQPPPHSPLPPPPRGPDSQPDRQTVRPIAAQSPPLPLLPGLTDSTTTQRRQTADHKPKRCRPPLRWRGSEGASGWAGSAIPPIPIGGEVGGVAVHHAHQCPPFLRRPPPHRSTQYSLPFQRAAEERWFALREVGSLYWKM
jgi:hypothetical protein